MARSVGLSRKITLPWLNRAVDLLDENLIEEEYKAKLNEYLSFEIESPTVLRKTREILMRLWFYEDDPDVVSMRKDARKLIKQNPDFDVAVHWGMLLIVYPVFADISRLIGKIAEFNNVVTLSRLKRKLYDEWGERITLCRSTDNIIATVKRLGAISSEKPGYYTIVKQTVTKPSVVSFMVRAAMKADGNSYYSFADLNAFDVLFPFEYKVPKEELMNDNRLVFANFGGELSIALN